MPKTIQLHRANIEAKSDDGENVWSVRRPLDGCPRGGTLQSNPNNWGVREGRPAHWLVVGVDRADSGRRWDTRYSLCWDRRGSPALRPPKIPTSCCILDFLLRVRWAVGPDRPTPASARVRSVRRMRVGRGGRWLWGSVLHLRRIRDGN